MPHVSEIIPSPSLSYFCNGSTISCQLPLHHTPPPQTHTLQYTLLPYSPFLDLTPWPSCYHPSLCMLSLPTWNSNSPYLLSLTHLSPTLHHPSFYCPLSNRWIHSSFLSGFNSLLWAITSFPPIPHTGSDTIGKFSNL